MTHAECPREKEIIAAVRSGEWSPELEEHRNGCLSCAELTLVAAALTADAEDLMAMPEPLPDPSPVWLRARLASKERDYERATRAIVWVQRAAVGLALAIGLAFAPNVWTMLKNAAALFDLGSPVLDIPRAAGSPLLVVVCSMVILGLLAVWELLAAREV
jgi:hypothetical protein